MGCKKNTSVEVRGASCNSAHDQETKRLGNGCLFCWGGIEPRNRPSWPSETCVVCPRIPTRSDIPGCPRVQQRPTKSHRPGTHYITGLARNQNISYTTSRGDKLALASPIRHLYVSLSLISTPISDDVNRGVTHW